LESEIDTIIPLYLPLTTARLFISLSYEYKMSGLLELLNLNDREIDISKIGETSFDKKSALQKLERVLGQNYPQAEEVKEYLG